MNPPEWVLFLGRFHVVLLHLRGRPPRRKPGPHDAHHRQDGEVGHQIEQIDFWIESLWIEVAPRYHHDPFTRLRDAVTLCREIFAL